MSGDRSDMRKTQKNTLVWDHFALKGKSIEWTVSKRIAPCQPSTKVNVHFDDLVPSIKDWNIFVVLFKDVVKCIMYFGKISS